MEQHRFVHKIRFRPLLTLLSIALIALGFVMQSVAILLGAALLASLVMAGLLADFSHKLYLGSGEADGPDSPRRQ
jgi:hypothetical protein